VSDLINSTGAYSTDPAEINKPEQPSFSLQDGWHYEATVEKIEAAIARIESGELDLADVFDQFEEAVEDLRRCETFLSDRQQQVDLLIETLSDQADY
jgi:exodeoxyribonuclease VII small subunit